jgi:hypothetical protein
MGLTEDEDRRVWKRCLQALQAQHGADVGKYDGIWLVLTEYSGREL